MESAPEHNKMNGYIESLMQQGWEYIACVPMAPNVTPENLEEQYAVDGLYEVRVIPGEGAHSAYMVLRRHSTEIEKDKIV